MRSRRELHGELLAGLGVDPGAVERAAPAPANLGYTSYLPATAAGGSYAKDFGTVVTKVLAVTDRLDPGPAERTRVLRHFRTTSRYEWMFWDMGYRKETWPVMRPAMRLYLPESSFCAGVPSIDATPI